jgi:ribose/xylose/arabinose/galactoside ABC-type transport system permease subunit
VFLGIAKFIAKETTIRPSRELIPDWINGLATPTPEPWWLFVAAGFWIILGMALLMGIVLRYTVFGRYVFALGSNEQTARLCGLNVPALKVAVYAVGGLFVGLGGVYQFAKLKEGSPISGLGMELKVIAAVVIGGASLNGGRGTILGVIIVAAVAVDQWRQLRTD